MQDYIKDPRTINLLLTNENEPQTKEIKPTTKYERQEKSLDNPRKTNPREKNDQQKSKKEEN